MRLEELLDVLWNPFTEPLPWPISLVPSFFRFISYAMLAPVFILSTLDLLCYIWFRLVHQPFGSARTMMYKQWPFPRSVAATPRTSPESSPTTSRRALPEVSPFEIDPASSTQRRTQSQPPKVKRRKSLERARARSVGIEGPLLQFETEGELVDISELKQS